MNINIPKNPAKVVGAIVDAKRKVTFVLDDEGQAHVSMILTIHGLPPIEHDEFYEGSKTTTLDLPLGKHQCDIFIAAYSYEAYGRTYDASVTANGVVIARAKGTIPQGKPGDRDFKDFRLDVVAEE